MEVFSSLLILQDSVLGQYTTGCTMRLFLPSRNLSPASIPFYKAIVRADLRGNKHIGLALLKEVLA